MLGIQMIDRLDYLHHNYMIHRDIKPDNFLLGLNENKHIVYLIDLGLLKRYYKVKKHRHSKFKEKRKFTGTVRYASINNLKRYQQSRRDDLESLGYTLLYLLRGNLPWQGLKPDIRKSKEQKVLELKQTISLEEELCKGFPHEFIDYINYTRNLKFEEKPDYDYLKKLLYNVLDKNKYEFDFWYDWVNEKPVITDVVSIERYINRHCIEINNILDYPKIKEDENVKRKQNEQIIKEEGKSEKEADKKEKDDNMKVNEKREENK